MRLLLDTHIALWAIVDDPRLAGAARELIEAPSNDVAVSAASLWEIAIKHALRRGDMPVSAADALGWFRDAGYALLDITPEHAAAVETLPPIHADPFDRLLIAQALSEAMALVSNEAVFDGYGVQRLW